MRRLRVGFVVAGLMFAGNAQAQAQTPTHDPFYAAPAPLRASAPGSVLRTRDVTVSFAGSPVTSQATQVLYRTTDQLGRPSATVATIIKPTLPLGQTKLLSYQTAYDGVADTCRPSFSLQTGNAQSNSIVTLESALILQFLTQGYTVVTTDYQGPTDDYGAGREEGRNTLDGIRAAERRLGLTARQPVGMIGYSGGSIASMWAAQEAPRYAPELNLIGTAAGGIPVDFTDTLDYIDGTPDWAGAMPAVGMGLARAYRVNLDRLLNDHAKDIEHKVETGCLDAAGYPGLKFDDLFKPRYSDWKTIPALVRIFNDSIMGQTGTPKMPLLLGVGDRGDGGDGVMRVSDVQELAHTYCERGVPVQSHVYANSDHTAGLLHFEPEAIAFLAQRYAGADPVSECPIAAAAPLTVLPKPKAKPALTTGIVLRRSARHSVEVTASTSALTDVRVAYRHRTVDLGEIGSFDAKTVPLPKDVRRVVATGRLQTAGVRTVLRVPKV